MWAQSTLKGSGQQNLVESMDRCCVLIKLFFTHMACAGQLGRGWGGLRPRVVVAMAVTAPIPCPTLATGARGCGRAWAACPTSPTPAVTSRPSSPTSPAVRSSEWGPPRGSLQAPFRSPGDLHLSCSLCPMGAARPPGAPSQPWAGRTRLTSACQV